MGIDSSQISVVVQGPIDRQLTNPCLSSVRRYLPDAEIILSTWRGSDIPKSNVDRVVLSDDPGGAPCTLETPPKLFNVNRQVVSTVAGLQEARRPFAVKIRTDMEMTGTGFLDLFEQFPARSSEMKIFERRLVTCWSGTHSIRRRGLVLHPSDWFDFGLREDLLTLWDVPLDVDGENARYFVDRPRPVPDRLKAFTYRLTPEQFVWVGCLRKSMRVDIKHLGDQSAELKRLTDLGFANNFIVATEEELGVHFRKYGFGPSSTCAYVTLDEWKTLYRRYCDPHYRGVRRARVVARHVAQWSQLCWYRVTARLKSVGQRLRGPQREASPR